MDTMYVVKRDGTHQDVSPDKVLVRLRRLCNDKNIPYPPLDHANATQVALKTISGIYTGVTTSQLDHLAETLAQPMNIVHPDNGDLASRIKVSGYHKDTVHMLYNHFQHIDGDSCPSVEEIEQNVLLYTSRALYENRDDLGNQYPLLHPRIYAIILRNTKALNEMIDYWRDYQYDCTGFATLEKSYLFKCSLYQPSTEKIPKLVRVPIERPQHMLMRVAIALACYAPYDNLSTLEGPAGRYNWAAIRDQFQAWPLVEKYSHVIKLLPKQHSELISDPYHKAEYIDIIKAGQRSWAEILAYHTSITGELSTKVLTQIRETYDLLSQKLCMHATPTLFAAGTLTPQLSSCFLITPEADSLSAMGKFIHDVMQISKYAGGVGSHHHKIRAQGAYIRGTNGISKGLPGFLQIVDKCSFYVDQGGGKRPGTHAVYLGPEHADIFAFLSSFLPRGNENERVRGLQGCVWIPDEFMRCLALELDTLSTTGEKMETWYLMCPDRSPGLSAVYDGEFVHEYVPDSELHKYPRLRFTHLYRKYIREGRYERRVSAVDLWQHLCTVLQEKGIPYLCYKDAINRKSNQVTEGKHGFIIESSNLCVEICEISTPDETAVCNLASIVLHMLVVYSAPDDAGPFPDGFETDLRTLLGLPGGTSRRAWIDFGKLKRLARVMIRNLNHVIDSSFYPIPQARTSNVRHRPLGLGVQGWADLLTKLRLAYDDPKAYMINWYVFEALYYGALEESTELAATEGPYETFPGSPASQGILQFDMWERELHDIEARKRGLDPDSAEAGSIKVDSPYPYFQDWTLLKERIKKHGLRNSLLIAAMPTASTGVIQGNSRSIEPHFALIMKLRKDGEDMIILKQFQVDMLELGLWTPEVRKNILVSRSGSIAEIQEIPELVRKIYRNAWDLGPKPVIMQAADRHWFIDQSQSMNLFLKETTPEYIAMVQFYAWRRGVKSGSYYTRSLPAVDAQKITVQIEKETENVYTSDGPVCRRDDPSCLSCQ